MNAALATKSIRRWADQISALTLFPAVLSVFCYHFILCISFSCILTTAQIYLLHIKRNFLPNSWYNRDVCTEILLFDNYIKLPTKVLILEYVWIDNLTEYLCALPKNWNCFLPAVCLLTYVLSFIYEHVIMSINSYIHVHIHAYQKHRWLQVDFTGTLGIQGRMHNEMSGSNL